VSAPESQSWRPHIAGILQAIAPAGIGVALLYYVGTVRNRAYFEFFQVDFNAVNLTVEQQVSESVTVILSVTLAGGAIFALYAIGCALSDVLRSATWPATRKRRVVVAVFALLMVLVAVLIVAGLTLGDVVTFAPLSFPVAGGVTLVAAALGVRVSSFLSPSIGALLGGISDSSRKLLRVSGYIVILAALLVTTVNYARAVGRGEASRVAQDVEGLPSVVLYSSQPLDINGPGVFLRIAQPAVQPQGGFSLPTERAESGAVADGLSGSEAPPESSVIVPAFPYSYFGLQVLIKTSDRYFLMSGTWTERSARAYVVTEAPTMRVEFGEGIK
jgi:hypothetical protein